MKSLTPEIASGLTHGAGTTGAADPPIVVSAAGPQCQTATKDFVIRVDCMKIWMLLLWGMLATSCASTNLPQQRWETAEADTAECDDPGADRCTMFLCGVGACGLYYCEDVNPARIVRAQAVAPIRPPMPQPVPLPTQANPQRYWGGMQGLPGDALPVFIIPWHETEEKYAARMRKEMEDQPKRTWVKHHVFPRAFKDWFKARGVNIHMTGRWSLTSRST
ncbi:TIGR02269 family lipoprotein [Myxococcus sp. RHSTA-1-4]|uniref:SitA6 family polymorphic toxin lipoprotein n=1 Tax=Myxococcus sp. RHSTA-1-4 TaxID=2874601 RepID=UPI002104E8EB|nr:TIGR02269 family lipoprotein [Myxococcus sp. RHSTA-1-4]MBZ4417659.1 TIGR02269 family lipoprotein [Myxococcus sp. RHSTA-1-4]